MRNILKPQPGPQREFAKSYADIVIFGGAAGGGKTYALLLEPLRYKNVQGFNAVIFRKNYTQVAAAGGLWDTSLQMYSRIKGARALRSTIFISDKNLIRRLFYMMKVILQIIVLKIRENFLEGD